jgi:hypothetical protein
MDFNLETYRSGYVNLFRREAAARANIPEPINISVDGSGVRLTKKLSGITKLPPS